MEYEIKKREGRWGFTGFYDVYVDGEDVGPISPRYKTENSNRPCAYWTEIMLEHDALTDDSGFPNSYRTLKEARTAVEELMERNGISLLSSLGHQKSGGDE